MKRILLILISSLVTLGAMAQHTVTGTVYDATDGQPLPGVSVRLKSDSKVGTLTDFDGKFSIQVPDGEKQLSFSFMGKTPKDVTIKAGGMKLFMEDDNKKMNEVVVVGYGSARKLGSVTGSVSLVRADVMEETPTANFTDALQGQVAGLSVLSSSGEPAASAVIRLRGINSIMAGTEPLFILDGTPITSEVFNALTPNDIQDVTVLKDAASTAIYGSRAANGVICITSKKGRRDMKPEVKVSGQYGFSNIINSGTEMMNSEQYFQYREMLAPSLLNNAEWNYHKMVALKNGISTDWMKETYRDNAPMYQINASVRGGSSMSDYYLSINHYSKDGIEPLSSFNRESMRFASNMNISNMFKMGLNANLSYARSETNPEQNASGEIYVTNPTVFSRLARPDDAPYYYTVNPDGSINKGNRADYLYFSGTNFYNPWYMAEHRQRDSRTIHIDGSIYEELTPVKGLKLRAVQALAMYDDMYTSISKPREASYFLSPTLHPQVITVDPYSDGTTGYRTESSQRWYQFTSSNTAEYTVTFKDKHELNVLLGHETIYSKDRGFAASRSGLTDPRMLLMNNAVDEPTVTQDVSESVFNSVFAQAHYNYADRYTVSASIRGDGSSRFRPGQRWGTFWSLGGRWNLREESFLQNQKDWLDQLSLKLSYGTTGNSSIGEYAYLGTVSSSNVQYEGLGGLQVTSQSVPNLTWEKTGQLNLGVEASFWDRLSVDIEFYNKTTSDMLMSIPYSYTTGYGSGMGNMVSMTNRGFEFTLNGTIIRKKDMNWTAYANLTYNKNTITELFDGQDEYVISNTGMKLQVGKPYGEFFLVRRAGVDPRDGKQMWYDCDGNLTKVFNQERDAVMTGKNRFAPWYGGMGTSFTWKGLTISADFTWALDKWAMNNDRYFYENSNFGQSYNQSVSMLGVWTKPGDVTDIPASTETIQMDDHVLENSSFLRLKKLSVSYNFPKKWLEKTKFIKGVNMYLTGRNLWTITNYTGYDPEPDSNVITFNYPNTRDFTVGCELTF